MKRGGANCKYYVEHYIGQWAAAQAAGKYHRSLDKAAKAALKIKQPHMQIRIRQETKRYIEI